MTDREPSHRDDLYGALGVPIGATLEEITRAYRRLAREHHPDTNPDAESDTFAGLTDAYDILRDPQRRRAYDDTRKTRARAARDATGVRIPIRHAAASQSAQTAGRVAVAEVSLTLTFEQAALGTTATIPRDVPVPCPDCGGTGRMRGSASACEACAGAGVSNRVSGGITIRRECPNCAGTGRRPPERCPRCDGAATVVSSRDVVVRVPAGVEDGARLRLRPSEAPELELDASVAVQPHGYFGRHGDDLTLRLPITLAEAALGAVVSIPTLTGAVAIRIPAGTRAGRTMRVRGHGISRGGESGDLLVTIDIVIPTELNSSQQAALEAFAAATDSPRSHFHRTTPPTDTPR